MSLESRMVSVIQSIGADIKSLFSRSLPAGGTAGQALIKGSSTDYDTAWVTPSSGSSIPNSSALLSANVTLSVSGTWYDGPGVSLAAGTWLVQADVNFNRTATTFTQWLARISTGTVHYASGQVYHASVNGHTIRISLGAIITLTGTTTIKVQATTNAGAAACLMLAATTLYGSGNNATQIRAIRLS